MKITSLTINNFGPYEKAVFQLGQHNLIIGPNGAGKSSFLRAIVWALTGACHVTTADGKGSDRLMRTGADGMDVQLAIEPYGIVTRARKGIKTSLVLSWADGAKVSENDPLLRATLNLPTETLMAMFDPVPILERDAKQQQAAILRVLRPAQITVPDSLIQEGITAISGIGHIETLISEHKEGTLRDLNRESKYLESHQPDSAGERPRNFDPAERQKVYDELEKKHFELTREVGKISQAIGTFEERIRRAEAAGAAPSQDDCDKLADAIEKADQQLLKAKTAHIEAQQKAEANTRRFAELTGERNSLASRFQNIADRLAELAKRPAFECPADACPIIKELAARADTEKQALEAEQAQYESKIEGITAEINKLETERADLLLAVGAAGEELEAREAKVHRFTTLAAEAERLAAIHKEAAVAKESLEQAQAKLQETNQALSKVTELRTRQGQAIERFHEWQSADEKLRKWREDVAANAAAIDRQRRIIAELELLRKSLIGDRSEQFLTIIREFLKPFGIDDVQYSFDTGFSCYGRGADMLSDGQKAMMFEAAFRSAIATITGTDIVVIDDLAPMTGEFRALVSKQLLDTGHQIIECVVADNPKQWAWMQHATVLYVSDGAVQAVSPAA